MELTLYLYRIIYILKNSELLYTIVCAHTHIHMYHGSWDSVVGTVTKLQMIKLRKSGFIHCKTRNCSFFQRIQIDSGARPSSYSMGTRGYFPRYKTGIARS